MAANKTKLEQYENIQALVQKEIETQFPKLYHQYAAKFGVADVPLHYHNGFDAPQIPAENIVNKMRASGSITLATDGRQYELQLTGTPTQILFYGNAVRYNGSTPDIRAFVVGSAQLGPSYFFQPVDTSTVSPSDAIGNVIQSCASYVIGGGGDMYSESYSAENSDETFTVSSTTGLSNGSIVFLSGNTAGNFSNGVPYYVINLTSTTFQLSDTPGGGARNVTSDGTGTVTAAGGGSMTVQTIASEGHIISVQYNGVIVARATIPNPWTRADSSFDYTTKGWGPGYVLLDVSLENNWEINGNFVVT